MSSTGGRVENSIRNKLHKTLEATYLEIINESHLHSAPSGAETHFKVVIVSKKFEDLPSLKRHRLVNETLRDDIRTGIRALSIVTKTPEQWAAGEEIVEIGTQNRSDFDISCNQKKVVNNADVARWP